MTGFFPAPGRFLLPLLPILIFLAGCTLTVIPGPRILKEPFPAWVKAGESAKFSVVAEGASSLNYRWYRNGESLSGVMQAEYITPALFPEDSGSLYRVEVSNREGSVLSLEAAVQVQTQGSREFPIGVWMQSPTKTWEGRSRAQVYRDLGINTFMGLWGWPAESYPGNNKVIMDALKAAGMKSYAGPTQDLYSFHGGDIRGYMDKTLSWLRENPGYEDVFKGFILGDEADMAAANFVSPQDTPKYAWAMPETFKENSFYFRNAYGNGGAPGYPNLKFFANFGKPFSKGMNYSKGLGNRRTPEEMAADFQLYMDPLDGFSSDFYGITDPYELRENHGVWTYGRSVTISSRYAKGTDGVPRENWGFLEASAPWRADNFKVEGNYLSRRQKPEFIAPIVWNMILHGASGFIYFCHDFLTPQSGISDAGCLYEPGIPQAMARVNAQVQSYSSFLLSEEAAIPLETLVEGPVPLSVLVRSYGGKVLVFAQGDGSTAFPDGAEIKVRFYLGEGTWKQVTVLEEHRTIPIVSGSFSDSFEPYQVHIYRLE